MSTKWLLVSVAAALVVALGGVLVALGTYTVGEGVTFAAFTDLAIVLVAALGISGDGRDGSDGGWFGDSDGDGGGE